MTSRGSGDKKNGRHQVDLDKAFTDGTAIDRAMRAAVVDAIRERKRRGLSIVEWSFEENRVVWTAADTIPGARRKKPKRAESELVVRQDRKGYGGAS